MSAKKILSKIFHIIFYLFLFAFMIIMVYPIFWILMTSLKRLGNSRQKVHLLCRNL